MKKKSYGVIAGRSGEYAGRRMCLYSGETVWFGSDSRNDTVLRGACIAALHCGIFYDGETGSFWMRNESGYGLLLSDGRVVSSGEEIRLEPGIGFRIGEYAFELREETSAASPETSPKAFAGFLRKGGIAAVVLLAVGIAAGAAVLSSRKENRALESTTERSSAVGGSVASEDSSAAGGVAAAGGSSAAEGVAAAEISSAAGGSVASEGDLSAAGSGSDAPSAEALLPEDGKVYELKSKYTVYVDKTNENNGGECRDALNTWKESPMLLFSKDSNFYILSIGSLLSSSGEYSWNTAGNGIELQDGDLGTRIYLDFTEDGKYLVQKYEVEGKEWTLYWLASGKITVDVSKVTGERQTEPTDSDEPSGIPVVLEDPELGHCIMKQSGYPETAAPTQELCQSFTELDTSGYALTTLADLEYFPNLEVLTVDNSANPNALSLKGINKAVNLKKLTLKNCGLFEVDRIGELTGLEYLDISTDSGGTNVEDYAALAALKKLKYLDMSWGGYNAYNEFHLVDGSFLNDLTSLEELNISETGIENYSLSGLSGLKRLTISQCSVDEVLGQLEESGALKQLVYLDTGTARITDAGVKNLLSKAAGLEELTICFDGLTSLKGMGNLQKLKELHVYNVGTFHIPIEEYDEIGKLTGLEELTFTDNVNSKNTIEGTTGPNDYQFLNSLKNLKRLRIGAYDGLSLGCFRDLKALEQLYLEYGYINNYAEVDIADIAEFTSLKELKYRNIRFKSTAPLDELEQLKVQETYLGEDMNF